MHEILIILIMNYYCDYYKGIIKLTYVLSEPLLTEGIKIC